MENFQKLELVLFFVILVFNILFFVSLAKSGTISGFLIFGNKEINSPSDFVNENNIAAYNDRVVIKIENPILTKYHDSGSMESFLSKTANGIEIKPMSESEISVGDVITYEKNDLLIVHRVIEIGKDEYGTYFITRGDNNNVNDAKVRFSQIKSILVGVIY